MKKKKQNWFKKTIKALIYLICSFLLYSILLVLLIKWVDPPTSGIIEAEKGLSFNLNFDKRFEFSNLNEISDHMELAVIASEDQLFPEHFGFDIEQIQKAIDERLNNERFRGASTISQQTAKNLFLFKDRTYLRKAVEAYFTLLLELFLTKDRILEIYLNIIEYGDGLYGISNASKIFFNKSPSDLTKYESALLAAVLPNPKKFSVKNPSAYHRRRANRIIRQMNQLGGSNYLKSIHE